MPLAKCTARVELHFNEIPNFDHHTRAYEILHQEMEGIGFIKHILTDGVTYQLPSAEYITEKNTPNLDAVLREVFEACNRTVNSFRTATRQTISFEILLSGLNDWRTHALTIAD